MIRVAVCDRDAAERIALRDAVERYVRSFNINNIEVTQFASLSSLAQTMERMRRGFFDLCFCRLDDQTAAPCGEAGALDSEAEHATVDAVRRLRDENPTVHIVLVSADKSQAIHAYDLETGFLLVADSYDDFTRVAAGPFDDIFRARSATTPVKSAVGVENVVLADIQFVESSKRGPVIHLPAGKTVTTRGTLQTLFATLEATEPKEGDEQAGATGHRGSRFIKAGSSFIVNLDNVRSAGEGSLIFADGETIIVPVRKRKAVLASLLSYRSR